MNYRFVLPCLLGGLLVLVGCEREAAFEPSTGGTPDGQVDLGPHPDPSAAKKAAEEQDDKDSPALPESAVPGSPLDINGEPPAETVLEEASGPVVYADRGDWNDWAVDVQEQVGVAPYGKWITFDPEANAATTPAFEGLQELKATFEVYFAPRFPLYTTPVKIGTELFSLHSGPHGAGDESDVRLAVNMVDGNMWRIESTYRTDEGDVVNSGDDFLMPWIFQHGWNRVIWTVLLREPGAGGDAMRVQVGDRIYSWKDRDLRAMASRIRHLTFGSWDVDAGQRHLVIRDLRIENLGAIDDTPPPPPPPSGTVLYDEDFEGQDPFHGWRGRNVRTNLQLMSQGGNHYGRLVYSPRSDWRISFLPRHQGVFDLRAEYSVRLPQGFRFTRYPEGDPREGQFIIGGKHFWMLQSGNVYDEGPEAVQADGQNRIDFGQWAEFGHWQAIAYRFRPGGDRPGEFALHLDRERYFNPGQWHRVRCDLHVNDGPGDDTGQMDLWIDGDHKGTFRGEFNVIGPRGGIRVLGFGNMDNIEGEPWVEVDDIRIEAR
jgi:hypothetical protein